MGMIIACISRTEVGIILGSPLAYMTSLLWTRPGGGGRADRRRRFSVVQSSVSWDEADVQARPGQVTRPAAALRRKLGNKQNVRSNARSSPARDR